MNYAFIGTGNMAGAILKGMKDSNQFVLDNIYAYDKDNKRLEEAAMYNVKAVKNELDAILSADIIILCVKPQNLKDLLTEVKEAIKHKLIFTIAAGKDIAFYENLLGEDVSLIRVMPNINAKVGGAICAVTKNRSASDVQLNEAKKVFSTIGSVIEIDEEFFPLFGAVAASSVAFVYMYIDALINSMLSKGMPYEKARKIAAVSVKGSAELVLGTNEECLSLTKQVCSPGGTTIEGVDLLNEYGFCDKITEAIEAILKKDEILRKG